MTTPTNTNKEREDLKIKLYQLIRSSDVQESSDIQEEIEELVDSLISQQRKEAVESYKSELILRIENTPAISTFSKDDPISYTRGEFGGLVDMDSYMKKRDIISLINNK